MVGLKQRLKAPQSCHNSFLYYRNVEFLDNSITINQIRSRFLNEGEPLNIWWASKLSTLQTTALSHVTTSHLCVQCCFQFNCYENAIECVNGMWKLNFNVIAVNEINV